MDDSSKQHEQNTQQDTFNPTLVNGLQAFINTQEEKTQSQTQQTQGDCNTGDISDSKNTAYVSPENIQYSLPFPTGLTLYTRKKDSESVTPIFIDSRRRKGVDEMYYDEYIKRYETKD